MLCHKKDDTEKRNEHIKHMVLVLVLVAILAGAPDLMFMIVGVDIDTGCTTDADDCLSQETDSLEEMLLGNADTGLIAYKFVIAFGGIIAMGYKGIAA